MAYARLSQDAAGLGVGVQAQLQDCRALAADRGFQIVREYVDNAQSASDTAPAYRRRRPAYEQLLTDIKAGRVDAVVVLSMERLWRSRTQRAADIELFQRHGVSLLTVRGPDVDLSTATGRLVFSVISELGVFELEQMQERQARAMLRRVESGAPPTGQRCYGYDRSGWQVVEAEAAVVRDVFEQFNAGASLSGLAAQLNQRGIPNRNGKPWTHNAVRVLLGNERYSARRAYQGKTYGGKWPAIVTLDQLLAAQARLADPSRTTSPGPASAHLLTGLAACGADGCVNPDDADGKPYLVTSGSRGKGQPVYRCAGPVKHLVRAAPALNSYVESVLLERLAAAGVAALMADGADGDEALAEARREAVALRAKLERLSAVFADSDDPDDALAYRDASRAARARLAAAEAKLADGERGRVLAPFATGRDPRTVWEGLDLSRRRAVVALLLDVTILSAARASKHLFDPSTVAVTWKGGPVLVEQPETMTFDGLADADARDLAEALRSGGFPVQRRGSAVTIPAVAVSTVDAVMADLRDWNLAYPLPGSTAIRTAVAAVVEQAPALTAAQRDALGALLG